MKLPKYQGKGTFQSVKRDARVKNRRNVGHVSILLLYPIPGPVQHILTQGHKRPITAVILDVAVDFYLNSNPL